MVVESDNDKEIKFKNSLMEAFFGNLLDFNTSMTNLSQRAS